MLYKFKSQAGADVIMQAFNGDQMLALIGTARSVPTLATLLRQPKTAESARYALEAISGPEADAALRAALADLTGDAKLGLLGSLAARQEPPVSAAKTTSR